MSNKNKEVLIYDIKSLPEYEYGLKPKDIFTIYQEERIVLWDSSNGGVEPKIIYKDEELPESFIVDLGSTELSESTKNKISKVINNETGE